MKRSITLILVLTTMLLLGACDGQATKKNESSVERVKKTAPQPTKAGAKDFTEQYWRLINTFEYEQVYKLLSPQDRKLVNKMTFITRTRQSNELDRTTQIDSVTLEGKNAKVKVSHEIVDPSDQTTKTISEFKITFIDGEWHPKLEKLDLFFYGASPSKIGIGRAAMGETFSIPAFSATVKNAARDKIKKDQYGRSYTVVELQIQNQEKQWLNFKTADYFAVTDDTQLTRWPLSDAEIEDSIELGPGSSAKVQVAFGLSEYDGEYSLLVGNGDDYYLIPLGL